MPHSQPRKRPLAIKFKDGWNRLQNRSGGLGEHLLGALIDHLVDQTKVPGGFGSEKITLVAALELLSALLFLLPVTRSVGLPFASAFLGGAIAAHVRAGEFAGALWPALFMSVCWMGVWLRYPEVLWSLNHRGQKQR